MVATRDPHSGHDCCRSFLPPLDPKHGETVVSISTERMPLALGLRPLTHRPSMSYTGRGEVLPHSGHTKQTVLRSYWRLSMAFAMYTAAK